MPRPFHFLPVSMFVSCASFPGESGNLAPEAVLSAGTPGLRRDSVEARINARPIRVEGEGFVVDHPGLGFEGRFGAEGLVVHTRKAKGELHIGLSAWGGYGSEQPVKAVVPELGARVGLWRSEQECARLLEYSYEGLTAWWIALDRGVKFGWTVVAPPGEGSDTLSFRLTLTGAREVWSSPESLHLMDRSGEIWRISRAKAWDAHGRPLPVWLNMAGTTLQVQVESRGAVYPVTVDPVLETATMTLVGTETNGAFGHAVAGAGDINGDGYDDVIIGDRWGFSPAGEFTGMAYVHLGSPSGLFPTAATTIGGEIYQGDFGSSVSSAGDLNGDGYADVLIGAPGEHPNGHQSGAVYVHHGSAEGVSPIPNRALSGETVEDRFGEVVAGVGDVNADGFDDVLVGAWYADNGLVEDAGAVYLYFGGPDGLSASADVVLRGVGAGELFGYSLAGAGDVNGDGFSDIVVGAMGYAAGGSGLSSAESAGAALVFHGSSEGVSSSADRVLPGRLAYDNFGISVAGAGDVNGDGFDDIVLGSRAMAFSGPHCGRSTCIERQGCDSRGSWLHPFANWSNVSRGIICDTLQYCKSTLRGGRTALFAQFSNRMESVSGFSPMPCPSQRSSCPPSDR